MSGGHGLRLYYGGTFDPVHEGHLAIARAARDELGVDVRFVPAADPPHRAPTGAGAEQRGRMLELAVAGEHGLRVDRRELLRAGVDPSRPSYTVDTLRELREQYGLRAPLAWLLGADSLASLSMWHEWTDILALAHIVVADRAGSPLDPRDLEPVLAKALEGRWTDDPGDLATFPAGRVLRLRQPLQPESASEVRRRIANGGDWRALLPHAVADWIVAHGLYGAGGGQRRQ